MDRLPDAELAYVEEQKVTGYLLAFGHPDGHGKAVYFSGFGFRSEEWRRLADALLEHAAGEIVEREETPFGVQYAVEGPLRAPDGRRPSVRSVWEERPGGRGPRLVTAYPGSRRR
ncbi:hypothetical protein GBA65_07235 [Rubrobacter marinus]|uniref:DUF6883 domain-containing protein n=1 Tax=Rubrobacter marinus TaxID=2653852 RepID=A0A6G8PVX2_9ACTN|nr:DUF6883 domain-containing protein [Rubrobacter marinus]QIN78346.1 hypothetical protein GBA65_07235 [Rubrobacter marinus]